MPLLTKKVQLIAKVEGTVGTAESLSTADGEFNAYDIVIQKAIEVQQRQQQGSFSKIPSVPGARAGRVTFSMDVIGGASDPPWAATFLPACGWVGSSHVYTPVSAPPGSGNVKTVTIGVYQNGMRKVLRGCMGSWSLTWVAGMPMRINFDFMGIWVAPTDTAMLSVNYPTTLPLRFASSAITLNSSSLALKTLTINSGNNVVMREDANDSSGYASAIVTDRTVNGSFDPYAELVATRDDWGLFLAGTEHALAASIGSGGAGVAIAAPKLQRINVQDEDDDGKRRNTIEFQCNASADAGDDEFSFTISQ